MQCLEQTGESGKMYNVVHLQRTAIYRSTVNVRYVICIIMEFRQIPFNVIRHGYTEKYIPIHLKPIFLF